VELSRQLLAGLEFVKETRADDGRLTLVVSNGGEAIPVVLRALEGRGIGIADISFSRPSWRQRSKEMKFLREFWLLFKRNVKGSLRNPVWLFLGLFQPALYLLLFAPLLGGLSNVPGFPQGGAYAVFTPGLLVLLALHSTAFAGFGLVDHIRSGLVERLLVTPVSRLAVLLVALKILGQSLIQGSLFSCLFLFSLSGSLASAVVMWTLRRALGARMSLVGVSVLGALPSNLGQLSLARVLVFGPRPG
jgi:hypothetical protein